MNIHGHISISYSGNRRVSNGPVSQFARAFSFIINTNYFIVLCTNTTLSESTMCHASKSIVNNRLVQIPISVQ